MKKYLLISSLFVLSLNGAQENPGKELPAVHEEKDESLKEVKSAIQKWIDDGNDINVIDADKKTPLTRILWSMTPFDVWDEQDYVPFYALMSFGPDVNKKDGGGTVSLNRALANYNSGASKKDRRLKLRVIKTLLHAKADITLADKDGVNALMTAADAGCTPIIKLWLACNKPEVIKVIDAIDEKRETALIKTIKKYWWPAFAEVPESQSTLANCACAQQLISQADADVSLSNQYGTGFLQMTRHSTPSFKKLGKELAEKKE